MAIFFNEFFRESIALQYILTEKKTFKKKSNQVKIIILLFRIVQIATEAGLRIAPDQWSSLLYGDPVHKSHMQSIIDKLQTPQSFVQSVQELVIALQRTGDPGHLTALRHGLLYYLNCTLMIYSFFYQYRSL